MRPSNLDETEEFYHAFCSGAKQLKAKIGDQEVDGEILEVLIYSGSMLAELQGQIVEIELLCPETIH